MTFVVHHGDCREVMTGMDAESVDAVVCDPPYGLSFMGKGWDHGVPGVEFWTEAMRVAKPGAHLLAFGGTRTFHRLACAIEDAGWEIRDCVMWVYGSGFPKSHDVSKAIDKVNGEDGRMLRFTGWLRGTGLTARQVNEITGTFMGSHYLTDKSQPAIPTPALWEKLRPACGDVPAWVDDLVRRIAAEREVVGQKKMIDTRKARAGFSGSTHSPDYDGSRRYVPITAPATDAARQWSGWGTALKPAWEPIIVARKPLCGTVAENVLTHGTGGINVDGCRVSADDGNAAAKRRETARRTRNCPTRPGEYGDGHAVVSRTTPERYLQERPGEQLGRWPANVIHDGSGEVESLAGSAARFFYCAKASKADRDEGCEGLESRTVGVWGGEEDDLTEGKKRVLPAKNHHPTVKPTALMRYLCRLVAPPGGVVLDPFTGSGSTGKAAVLEGFDFVGIEREAEYVEIARARIAAAAGQRPLLEATA